MKSYMQRDPRSRNPQPSKSTSKSYKIYRSVRTTTKIWQTDLTWVGRSFGPHSSRTFCFFVLTSPINKAVRQASFLAARLFFRAGREEKKEQSLFRQQVRWPLTWAPFGMWVCFCNFATIFPTAAYTVRMDACKLLTSVTMEWLGGCLGDHASSSSSCRSRARRG